MGALFQVKFLRRNTRKNGHEACFPPDLIARIDSRPGVGRQKKACALRLAF
jgi:hypothetical protein